MILEFSIENYRSFKEKQTFSMIPDDGKTEFEGHIFHFSQKQKILTSGVLYGANASGKSNFMKALQALRDLILKRANTAPTEKLIAYEPFKFSPETAKESSFFELNFIVKEVRYKYQLKLNQNIVEVENLYFYPEGKEAKLFQREGQNFSFGDYLKGQKSVIKNLTANNQLFLSKGAKNNMPQLQKLYTYFVKDFMPIPFLDSWVDNYYFEKIAALFVKDKNNDVFIHNFKTLLKSFDTGIFDFHVREIESYLPFGGDDFEILVEHEVFGKNGKKLNTTFLPIQEESTGTQKLFVLGGLILRALMNGRVIMIDEFERSLHPMISSFLIDIFNNPAINTKGAQLIIATHDTNLLNSNDLRRDQIWIIEKDEKGASELFSLADMNGILKNAPYEKWYLSGRFGGIPVIETLNFELNYKHEENQTKTASI